MPEPRSCEPLSSFHAESSTMALQLRLLGGWQAKVKFVPNVPSSFMTDHKPTFGKSRIAISEKPGHYSTILCSECYHIHSDIIPSSSHHTQLFVVDVKQEEHLIGETTFNNVNESNTLIFSLSRKTPFSSHDSTKCDNKGSQTTPPDLLDTWTILQMERRGKKEVASDQAERLLSHFFVQWA